MRGLSRRCPGEDYASSAAAEGCLSLGRSIEIEKEWEAMQVGFDERASSEAPKRTVGKGEKRPMPPGRHFKPPSPGLGEEPK